MSTDMVIVFIFFARPIRGYSPGGLVNNFYSHGRRVNNGTTVRRQKVKLSTRSG